MPHLPRLLRPHPGWVALAAAIALTYVGIAAIDTVEPAFAAGQKRNLAVALLGLALVLLPDPRLLARLAYPAFAVSLGLLVFVLIPFVPESLVRPRNGARSWIDLKLMDFQPSEMAKVAYVLSLAVYLRYRQSQRTLRGLLLPFGFMLVPVALILLEPDLGTALVFPPTLFVILVASGAKLRHLGSLLALAVLAVAVNVGVVLYAPPSMQLLKPHQQTRIRSMISLAKGDTRYIQSDAYQQHKAMTLVGAGGVGGYGHDQSQTILRYNPLPEGQNDMIYAVVVNRWGLLGALGTLGLYTLLVAGLLGVSARSRDPVARLACVGFAGILTTQVTVNVGMTVGLLPITGITLPFLSYGGSSLLFSFIMIGLTLNFASRKASPMARPSFEFDGRGATA